MRDEQNISIAELWKNKEGKESVIEIESYVVGNEYPTPWGHKDNEDYDVAVLNATKQGFKFDHKFKYYSGYEGEESYTEVID